MFLLSCVKTGKWWELPSERACLSVARSKGLVDYEITPPSARSA